MRKKFFPIWYYGHGLKEFLEAEKNILFFSWWFFSVTDLILTLFSPWKRDISAHNWRGFQPLKAIEALINNLISRFLGSIVRSAVIAAGLSMASITLFLCLIFLLAWIMPLLLFSVYLIPEIPDAAAEFIIVVFFIAYLYIVYRIHKFSNKTPYSEMGLEELFRQKFFSRVLQRMGGKATIDNPEDLLDSQKIGEVLKNASLSQEEFNQILSWEMTNSEESENKSFFWLKENLEKIRPIGSQWKYAYTVKLDHYSLDLTSSDPTEYRNRKLIGRQNEMNLINVILSRADQNNILLTGDEGIGKTTLIHNLAAMARLEKSKSYLNEKRILMIDLGMAISDAVARGKDIENALHLLFQEATGAGNVILVIKNIENFLRSGDNELHPDISVVMNEYLAYPNFQVLATSTNKEYHQLIEKHESFMKYFEVVEMKEPTDEEAIEILLENFKHYETRRVFFTYKALEHIVALSGKYKWENPLPERAIDLAEKILNYWGSASASVLITPDVVDEFVSIETGTPQGAVGEEEREKLLNLEDIFHQRIVGQDEAVRQVAEALRRARSGINDPKKPVGSFLFLGPTGIGKTETAKALAEGYYGNEERMIRLDMSEFQTPASIDRILGSSQLNQPGQLVNLVKDNPFSLLLLDELEKANPRILDLFLQVLDEGFITDAFGEKINFRNMIIIATSNAGSVLIKNRLDEGADPLTLRDELINHIVEKNIFRIEFLNRFDAVVFFRPLNGQELENVVRLMLDRLAKRLKSEKSLNVAFSEGIIGKIIEQGYSPIFGARSLNRFIDDKVENVIARKIITGEASKNETIAILPEDI